MQQSHPFSSHSLNLDTNILEILWLHYRETTLLTSPKVKASEAALSPYFESLPLSESDELFGYVSDLVSAYQHAAFTAGIRVGFHLVQDLEQKSQTTNQGMMPLAIIP